MLTKAFENRDITDYDVFAEFKEDIAKKRIEDTEEFIIEMSQFLRKE